MNNPEEANIAIYIIGPDTKHNYKKEYNFLSKKFKKVIVIGDGENDILSMDNAEEFQKKHLISDDNLELKDVNKVFIYLNVHGKEIYNAHYIKVSKQGQPLESRKLFELLSESINLPMDIVFTPCHGKAALKDVNVLPEGSRIVMFSEHDKVTMSTGIHKTMDKMLLDDSFNLDKFYNNYLANVMIMDENPIMSVIGGNTIDPVALSENYLGKNISEESRQYVQGNFAQEVCGEETSCHDRINQLVNKIEQASSMDEFRLILDEKYLSLLNKYADLESQYSFSRNTHHEQEVKYASKELEVCYMELLGLKKQADQLFLENKIPLELDASYQDWYDIDYDYASEEDLELFNTCSNDGIYNFFIQSGFIENDNFPKPDFSEYGYVLGIIKDVHFSLSI